MGKAGKILAFTVFGGGALLLLAKVSGLANFARVLTISPKLENGIKGISFKKSKLNIPLSVDFANRSDQEVTVGVSSIILYYSGKQIGEIRPNTSNVLVKKYSTSTLEHLVVEIPLLKLLGTVGSAINTIITSGDYTQIVNAISLDITCILNNSIVFNFVKKIGETQQVNVNNGSSVGNLGLVAKSERVIRPMSDYEMYIPPKSALKYNDYILMNNIEPQETPAMMHKIVDKYYQDTEILAKQLAGKNLQQTLQSIFDFVYQHIAYVPDVRTAEQVRRPLRTLYDRKGDCDCYSVLIASMLKNLNIPYKFRIAAYNGRPNYQHVYVIVPYMSSYYVCDPVLDRCFDEKKPSKYLDF